LPYGSLFWASGKIKTMKKIKTILTILFSKQYLVLIPDLKGQAVIIEGQCDDTVAYRMFERAFWDRHEQYADSIAERIHLLAAQDIIDQENNLLYD
jgi:hypothetical protein